MITMIGGTTAEASKMAFTAPVPPTRSALIVVKLYRDEPGERPMNQGEEGEKMAKLVHSAITSLGRYDADENGARLGITRPLRLAGAA
jgi:hypothetical protein